MAHVILSESEKKSWIPVRDTIHHQTRGRRLIFNMCELFESLPDYLKDLGTGNRQTSGRPGNPDHVCFVKGFATHDRAFPHSLHCTQMTETIPAFLVINLQKRDI